MRFVGYKTYVDFESDGWWWSFPPGFQLATSLQTTILQRAGTTPTLGLGLYVERIVPGAFGYNGATPFETARNELLQKLNILDPLPGTLYAVMNDGTPATIQAVLSLQAGGNAGTSQEVNTVPATFTIVDPVFVASTPASVSASLSGTSLQSLSVPAIGFGEQDAVVTLQQTAARSTHTEAAGWTLRRKYTLANTSGRALTNYPVAIDLGSTTALVTGGKALASGNDVRVIYGGKEVPRTLVGWNTSDTLCWIIIDNLPAGASRTYEVWYGNSGAGSPSVLSGSNLPAFDLATSTNAAWKYLVARIAANAGKGGWNLSSGTQTPTTPPAASPGSWQIGKTYGENSDDIWQAYYSTYTDSGTKYQGRFDAKRLYQKSKDFPTQQYADGDGVVLANPLGITQVRADIDYEIQQISGNNNDPVGQVVLLSQPTPGAAWQTVFAITATGGPAQQAVANYAISPTAYAVAFGVWPPDGQGSVDKKTKVDRYVYGGWYSVLEVSINSSLLTQTLSQAEETIMDVAATIYDGGGTSHVAPYKVLRIGGASNRRYATRLNEKLTIDAAARTATLYQSDGTTVVETVPVAAYDAKMVNAGEQTERTADRWLPLDPTSATVFYFLLANGGSVTASAGYRPTFL